MPPHFLSWLQTEYSSQNHHCQIQLQEYLQVPINLLSTAIGVGQAGFIYVGLKPV